MKKILETLCGLGCLITLVFGCAQQMDGGCDLSWTIGCLLLSALFGWAYGKLSPKTPARHV